MVQMSTKDLVRSIPRFLFPCVLKFSCDCLAAIYHGGRTWIVFSASNCAGTGYTLGRLELVGSNPLSASSWSKYSNPIFTSANGCVVGFSVFLVGVTCRAEISSFDFTRNYQPGHNGFFLGPSGANIYNVYHANSNSPGACDGSRYTLVQPYVSPVTKVVYKGLKYFYRVNWNSDGTPNLGQPLPLSQSIAEPV